jgi:hypothetical protein
MTSMDERRGADLQRDDMAKHIRKLGHRTMTWKLAPNSRRRGHAYHWLGMCEDCGAEVSVGASWSSCPSVRDARHDRCSGPGTKVLTEIEAARASELIAAAGAEFLKAVRRHQARRN